MRVDDLASAALTWVLGVVCRTIARDLISQAGLTRTRTASGSVTLIQRFGSALNLNIPCHMLFLDGAYPSRMPTHRCSAAWQGPARRLAALVQPVPMTRTNFLRL